MTSSNEVHRVMSNVKQPDCTVKTPPDHPKHKEEVLDEGIEETFPASDPVSVTIDRSPEERGQPSKLVAWTRPGSGKRRRSAKDGRLAPFRKTDPRGPTTTQSSHTLAPE
jgi:hypothetical protein